MEILSPTRSDQVPSALNDPSGNLLRPAQLTEHVNDIRIAEGQLANPNVQEKGEVRKRIASLKRQYDSQAPRPITDGALKDRLMKESDQLLSEILPGMLSHEEMRKNPAGSVDKHMRWERANKPKIMQWKKNMCVLNADNSDPHTWDRDAANLERFRPQGPQDRLRTDAQISGHMTYASVPDDKWKAAFGTTEPENSALNQARRAQDESLKLDSDMIGLEVPPPIEKIQPRGRKPMTPERKAVMLANLARGREAKKAKTAV